MVRKNAKQVSTYESVSAEKMNEIIMATSGKIKDKDYDPRKIVGSIHVKKYLADTKINGKVESWIAVLKKLLTPAEDGQAPPELTADEFDILDECKKQKKVYLEDDEYETLKVMVAESSEVLKNP